MAEEVTVAQARKKWTQLVRRYLELKVLFGRNFLCVLTLCVFCSHNMYSDCMSAFIFMVTSFIISVAVGLFVIDTDLCYHAQGPDSEEPKDEMSKDSFQGDPHLITSDLGTWRFFPSMHSVMEAIKATSPDGGAKSRRSPEYTCEFSFLVIFMVIGFPVAKFKNFFSICISLSPTQFVFFNSLMCFACDRTFLMLSIYILCLKIRMIQ